LAVSVEPWNASIGSVVNFSVQVQGGLPPYRATWGGLPIGCGSMGLTLSCEPQNSGSFALSVNVTDSNGFEVSARAYLVVSNVTLANASSTWTTPEFWFALLCIGAVVAVGSVFYVRNRRAASVSPHCSYPSPPETAVTETPGHEKSNDERIYR
jgi:hypothetical protein